MIRSRDEWYEFAMKRGTSGSMVFDILKDWKEDHDELQKIVNDYQDDALLDYQEEHESHSQIEGIARFRGEKRE